MILALYRFLTLMGEPLVLLGLRLRARKGKEDTGRLHERFGRAKARRPDGPLLWIHGASVGESRSVLPLLDEIRTARPDLHFLLTTGTVSSAKDIAPRLPRNTIHQFVPVDHPRAVQRFFDYWQPVAGLILESELWPNLLMAATRRNLPLALVNARLSPGSFRNWQRAPRSAARLLAAFDIILAQDDEIAERFKALKAPSVVTAGNLKLAAPPLSIDGEKLDALKNLIGTRPVWVAASTHKGEEEVIGAAHLLLKKQWPDMLTIIAPRHPERGAQIAGDLRNMGLITRLRSSQKSGLERADIYIADTMGELGLLYALSPIAFMGGSLIPHGGQNPLEPARARSAILTGPHTHNFSPTYKALAAVNAVQITPDAKTLAAAVRELLRDTALRQAMTDQAAKIALGNEQVLRHVTDLLLPLFSQGEAS
ncbi:MAG: 3-deoxy-D-manno-octulosonic acid transferase [Alphaproteobacteria bacterium]